MEREERCGGEDNLEEKRMLGFEDKREAVEAEQAMFESEWRSQDREIKYVIPQK